MTKQEYDWTAGVVLKEHTRCKLDIIREYFHDYLRVKCSAMNRSFRIAIVDGFAGGGRYKNGESGSPLVFLEELEQFVHEEQIRRKSQNLPEITVECLFIANEIDENANAKLDEHITNWKLANTVDPKVLSVDIKRFKQPFTQAYLDIKNLLLGKKFQNIIFNIDPCGYTQFQLSFLKDIMKSFRSPEIFYTFMIGSLFNYASWENKDRTQNFLRELGFSLEKFFRDDTLRTKNEWLGAAEKVVYDEFIQSANYVSPFAINQSNGTGYNYWLLHFSSSFRAREVYNDVLHRKAHSQAHVGRSGLRMLEYTADARGIGFFDFSPADRAKSLVELHNDIPSHISEFGDAMNIAEFKSSIYNSTPAHSEDIIQVLFENPDIEVYKEDGGRRKKASTISNSDFVRISPQRSFFSVLNKK